MPLGITHFNDSMTMALAFGGDLRGRQLEPWQPQGGAKEKRRVEQWRANGGSHKEAETVTKENYFWVPEKKRKDPTIQYKLF